MHQILFSLLLIFSGLIVNAQNYLPFSIQNASWKYRVDLKGACWDCCTEDLYYYDGDTVISGLNYTKVSVESVSYSHQLDPSLYCTYDSYLSRHTVKFVYGYRNDVLSKKVFYYDSNIDSEYLMFDFELEVGDKLNPNLNWYKAEIDSNFIVTEIDSMFISNRYHKRYTFTNTNDWSEFYLVEGIGYTHRGSPYYTTCFESCISLVCFSDEFGEEDICNFPQNLSLLEVENFESIFFLPNPTNGQISIQNIDYDKITVYDCLGVKVFEKLKDTDQNKLNLSFLSSGNYLVEIMSQQKRFIRKLILEK